MSDGLEIRLTPEGTRLAAEIRLPKPLPLAQLVSGRSPFAVAELLPRLFNLCAEAQGMAARLALGLPMGERGALAEEIRREHLLKLTVIWPGLLGLPTAALPQAEADLRRAVFGGPALPDPAGFESWLASDAGVAPLLRRIAALFAAGEAVADLPALPPRQTMSLRAFENSPAARQAAHPLLVAVAERQGKGPLWRVLGRLVDLQACLAEMPRPLILACGAAIVPAARGSYGLRAQVERGQVTGLSRVTPTDHLTAPGGVLAQSLASLPADKVALAPLLVSILDPCLPVELREVEHA